MPQRLWRGWRRSLQLRIVTTSVLLSLLAITVVGGAPLPVGTGYRPPPDPTTDPVLVPLPPEVCG